MVVVNSANSATDRVTGFYEIIYVLIILVLYYYK